jgi:hypothetical protein
VSGPHLPDDVRAEPRGVVPLGHDLGTVAGQRLVLLSLERWDGWADLRFARIEVDASAPRLARRVPPVAAWQVSADGTPLAVIDAVGRGDRAFSNGEVRLVPAPADGARLDVKVTLVPGRPPLAGTVRLGPARTEEQ